MNKKLLAGIIMLTVLIGSCFGILSSQMENKLMAAVEVSMIPEYEKDLVFRNGPAGSDKMAITCNVDWGEEVIPEILDICKDKNVKITFFVSGKWVEKNGHLLREMFLAGHDIQSHGYGHKMSSKLTDASLREEITKTEAAIENVLGVKTDIFAPPSGDYDKNTVSICDSMGYIISLWSVDTIDWKEGSTADVIISRVFKKNLDGAILLMHPKPETAKALPEIIDGIIEKNIEIVPLKTLINPKNELQ